MKVALVTSYLSRTGGGVSVAVQGLSRSLRSAAADVHVIGLHDREWYLDANDWNGTLTSALDVRGPTAIGYAPQATVRLREIDVSIAHTHGIWTYQSHAVARWSSRNRRPYIVSPHGMLDAWAMRHARWKKAIAARLYEDAHLRGANCLHALCESEARSIRSLGLDNPICVIPNGVTLPSAIDDCDAPPWRDRIPPDSKIMLFLGRLHPKKNILSLIDAWPACKHSNDWHLVIAGWDQGNHAQVLSEAIKKRELEQSIHIIGPFFGRDKDCALRRAHAFVLPSLSEGLPMGVLEAWSYGLPVLMTDACNLAEGFVSAAAIRLSTDTHHMSRDVRNFLHAEPCDLQRMGCNGRQLVERRFTWDSAARAMLAVYDWQVNGAPRPDTIYH